MRTKLKTRLAAQVCAAALLAMMLPAAAASAPSVSIGSATVTQGGTCTLTVSGSGLKDLTSLKLTVAYDASAFDVVETATASMDVATADHLTDGKVEYIGISVDGISGSRELLSITFLAANTAPGDYPVTLFVGGSTAAGAGGDEYVTVAVQAGTLTVKESGTVHFYSHLSSYAVESGDEVTMTISSYSSEKLAGGRFVFSYDSNFLAYKEGGVELLNPMTGVEHTVTVNASNAGRVSVAYAATEAVGSGELMRITFVVRKGVSGETRVTMSPEMLTDVDGGPLTGMETESFLAVAEKSRVWIELPEEMNTHEAFAVGFWVDGGGEFAAGDFAVQYDETLLECLSVTSELSSGESGGADNGFVVINDDYREGTIEFSALCPEGLSKDTKLLTIVFRAKGSVSVEFALTSMATTTPVNRQGDPIVLQCDGVDGTLETPDHACENGYCNDCNRDMAQMIVADGQAKISVPGVVAGANVLVAFYGEKGNMLRCQFCTAEEAEALVVDMEGASGITVFVVSDQWDPLRDAISRD